MLLAFSLRSASGASGLSGRAASGASGLYLCFTLRPAIFNSAMRRLPLVQGVWNILVSSLVRWQARVIYKSATKDVEALMNKTSVLFIYF